MIKMVCIKRNFLLVLKLIHFFNYYHDYKLKFLKISILHYLLIYYIKFNHKKYLLQQFTFLSTEKIGKALLSFINLYLKSLLFFTLIILFFLILVNFKIIFIAILF